MQASTAHAAPRPAIAVLSQSPRGVPVLAVNGWSGRDQPAATRDVRSALAAALRDPVCGVVVDLTRNRGGNMWPMAVGLLPLFSEGVLGGFEDREGRRTWIAHAHGQLSLAGAPHVLNARDLPRPASRPPRIAILLGPGTASSGEIIAVLFRGQAGVLFFGRPSAGVPTANRTFALPDGGVLALTTAASLDRNATAYRGPIAPDIETDDAVAAADGWIAEGCPDPRRDRAGQP